jgi:hypothetical protein
MSSAILEILDIVTLDIMGYGEYHGTSDSVPSEFVINYNEIEGQKPYFLGYMDCICDVKFHQGVILYSNYGGGFYWPSKVCMACKVITGITSPYEPDWGYSITPKDEEIFWERWSKEGWPKSGDPRINNVC